MQKASENVLGHQRRHSVPDEVVKVRALVNERQIKEIRESLHPRRLVRRQHSGLQRVGEASSAVAAKARGEGWRGQVPVHATVDRRIGVVTLLAGRTFTVREVLDVIVNEVVHATLIHGCGVGGVVEHSLRRSSLALEVVNGPSD